MRINLYAVYDDKAKAFSAFHTLSQNGQAIRNFSDAVKSEKSDVSSHPEDYSLFRVASINSETGDVLPVNPVEFLTRGSDWVDTLTQTKA